MNEAPCRCSRSPQLGSGTNETVTISVLRGKPTRRIGGVAGALARHAEATLERIGTERLDTVREIFRNLTTADGTRASRDRNELLLLFNNRDEADSVCQSLTNARLLTTFEIPEEDKVSHRVEIVHESLLKHWPRLVRWQTQDADSVQLRDQLHHAAKTWESRGKPTELLWTGKPSRELKVWRENYPHRLTSTENTFVDTTNRHAGRRRRMRRLAAAAVFFLLAGGLSFVTALWRQSISETRRAEAGKLLALGQRELERYPTAALAYAFKSLELSDTREARVLALRALYEGPPATVLPMDYSDGLGAAAYRLDMSPGGEWLAISAHEVVHLRARGGGGKPIILTKYPTSDRIPVWARFSPKGDHLITLEQGELKLWSVPELKELVTHPIEPGAASLVVADIGYFTCTTVGNEELVRAGTFDGEVPRFVGRIDPAGACDVDPMGQWLAYPRDQKLFLRSLEEWKLPPRLVGEHSSKIRGVRFHPSGKTVAAADHSGGIRIWPASSEEPERNLADNGSGPRGTVAFDRQGTRLVVGGESDQHTVDDSSRMAWMVFMFGASSMGARDGCRIATT